MTFITQLIVFLITIIKSFVDMLRHSAGFARMVLVALAAMSISAVASAQTLTLRVDIENGSPNGDGSAWGSDAIRFLQDALSDAEAWLAENEFGTVEIWVAQGTYDAGNASFELLDHVGIFGGFVGSEEARFERRPLENMTILTAAAVNVVQSSYNNNTARLDGFTILPGAVMGIYLLDSQAVISNCTVRESAGSYAVLADIGAPLFINCTITQTKTPNGIAAVFLEGAAATLINCNISNNHVSGVHIWANAPSQAKVTIINSTIAYNGPGFPPQARATGIDVSGYGSVDVVNTILWGNTISPAIGGPQNIEEAQ